LNITIFTLIYFNNSKQNSFHSGKEPGQNRKVY